MLGYIALAVAMLVVIHLLVKGASRLPPKTVRYIGSALLVMLGIAVVVGLLRFGQAHMAAILGAGMFLAPFLRRFLIGQTLRRASGSFRKKREQQRQANDSARANHSQRDGPMSEDEARKVLGLEEGASRKDIIDAYKHLMQKNHPDQGGSSYLATKINQARDVLLGK